MTATVRILIGLVSGALLGFVVGEPLPLLDTLGKAFISALHMTVLPFIIVSIVLGLGALGRTQMLQIARFGGLALLLLLGITAIVLSDQQHAFPDWENAQFFRPSLLQPASQTNLVLSFIPANIFNAMADAAIPSVVFFSGLFGIALSTVNNKEHLLNSLAVIQATISKLTGLVMTLAPVGVFAIMASTVAAFDSRMLGAVSVYLALITIIAVFLGAVVLPLLASALTPFHYRDIVRVCREPLITALATGNYFIVLPLISRNLNTLLSPQNTPPNGQGAIVNVLVPLSYSLPGTGKLLALVFIVFAGWFSDTPLTVGDTPELLFSGFGNLFGSTSMAVTTLLKEFGMPSSLYDLYVATDQIIGGRLISGVSVIFIVAFVVLTTAGINSTLKVSWKKLSSYAAITLTVTLVLNFCYRTFVSHIDYRYEGYQRFIHRELLLPAAKQTRVVEQANLAVELYPNLNTFERIMQRKRLRVGYFRDWLPYAFHNSNGELVGLDVELCHLLARDLGVAIEFVKIYRKEAPKLLRNGYLDMTVGVPMALSNLKNMTLSDNYLMETMALVVPRKDWEKFTNWQDIKKMPELVLGIPDAYFSSIPLAPELYEFTVWEVATPRMYFRDDAKFDVMLFGAMGANAWTMIEPDYKVVIPEGARLELPLAFPLSYGDKVFESLFSNWLKLVKQKGTVDYLYRYWVEGREANEAKLP